MPNQDRSQLDQLIQTAYQAHNERDAIESPTSPEWHQAHLKTSAAWQAVYTERKRLWKLSRWGRGMNNQDKQLATITGEL